jgi:hypothetical protein
MKLIAPVVLLVVVVILSSCVYTQITMPLTTELNRTELGHKRGESSMYSYFWLVAVGDAGAATAAKRGGISIMTHMDREYQSVLYGIYTRTTTIVYGD